jgi:Kef-type K+ transport system membrane component KefB
VAAAAIGKLVGVGYMSRFFGVRGRSAKLLGIMMIPRGNENVALVQVILLMGAISYSVYTSIVFATVATILVTPVIMKVFYRY